MEFAAMEVINAGPACSAVRHSSGKGAEEQVEEAGAMERSWARAVGRGAERAGRARRRGVRRWVSCMLSGWVKLLWNWLMVVRLFEVSRVLL